MTDEAVETVIPEESDRATIIDLRVRLREAEERVTAEEDRADEAVMLGADDFKRVQAAEERAEKAEAEVAGRFVPVPFKQVVAEWQSLKAENERLRLIVQAARELAEEFLPASDHPDKFGWFEDDLHTPVRTLKQALGEEAKT